TEVVIWGGYLGVAGPGTRPVTESWTVIVHGQDDPGAASAPEIELSRQVLTRFDTVETGGLSGGVDEYRWVLRLREPVFLPSPGFYWVEAFHDSPDADVAAVVGSAPLQLPPGPDGYVLATAAPGESWAPRAESNLAMELCGFDARWGGLIVPGFEVDLDNPDEVTLFAVRNTRRNARREIRVRYFGDAFSDGLLREDAFVLEAGQTSPINVGLNTTGLDPDGDGRAAGFIVISGADGAWDDLEGDFSRVDFANDFAAGSRLFEADDFCRRQEIRAVDFGSGSDFGVLLRESSGPGPAAMVVTVLDEAGNLVGERSVPRNSANVRRLAIEELDDTLDFGTLIFDFTPSGGGVVTGRYSAFGRFSTEVNGACRD
ncbi:MAG: hypothetical protein AAGF23_15095, partial [Acidobacteriota bacterium]